MMKLIKVDNNYVRFCFSEKLEDISNVSLHYCKGGINGEIDNIQVSKDCSTCYTFFFYVGCIESGWYNYELKQGLLSLKKGKFYISNE